MGSHIFPMSKLSFSGKASSEATNMGPRAAQLMEVPREAQREATTDPATLKV